VITSAEVNRAIHQKKSFASAWDNQFGSWEYQAVMRQDRGTEVIIDWADNTSVKMSAAQLHDLVFEGNNQWMLSANGTLFTYEFEAIIPGLLKRWYAERKEMQKKMQECGDNEIEREFWDKRQLVKKINLNSLYGAILNPGCRFFDIRIGQSVTLTARCITRHMASKTNEVITGAYDHRGDAIIYGDSVTKDTKIKTDSGEITIEQLYNECLNHSTIGEKEYGVQSMAKVVGFNSFEDATVMSDISYVMRHKTVKKIYKITLENNKEVKVTEDHSVIVDRDGFLIEVKPTAIKDNDLIICLNT